MLVEGNSIRATCRMSGASKTTVTRLLVDAGRVAAQWHGEHVRDLPCRRVRYPSSPPAPRARRAEPGERAVQEGQGVGLAVTEPYLGIGQARVVVDGHSHVLPAGAGAGGSHPIAGDALADVPETARFLGVEVQQLSGVGALVAHDRGPRDARAARLPPPP